MALSSQFADLAVGTSSATGGGGVVYTEQRGIHIRDLSRRASEDQVRKMIREAAGREADLINGVEVPLDKDRNPRGWALVHFRSADLARRMVGVLDGAEFKGRKLGVRLLKEGETVGASGVVAGPPPSSSLSSSSSSRGHRSGRHGERRDEGARRREKDRGERSSASSKSSPPSSGHSGPLVVGSSTVTAEASSSRDKGKGKGKEKEKEKDKDRHGGSSSKFSVVIADGSLGRRRSDSDRRGS
jgi:RNA recognition motif-containing protein